MRQAWSEVQLRLPIDAPVSGKVFSKAPYGAWIDIGVGFPALLLIPFIAGLTPARYRQGDWCPVGSQVSAFIRSFHADGGQISLWQVKRPESTK